MMAIIIVCV